MTSARLRRFFRAFHLHLERCCHRPGRVPCVPSRFYPHMRMSHSPVRFRVLLLRRLRLPLPLSPRACTCRQLLDVLGDHRAACATAGVLASRAIPLERALARVCREASARVTRNVRLADMNLDVPVQDARRIEVVCNWLPLWHGEQRATLVSPLGRDGQPRANADAHPGIDVAQATRRKRCQIYPELERARRCRLVVCVLEVGGKWTPEAATFIRLLARARAAEVPTSPQAAPGAAWVLRWSGILADEGQRALSASLLELAPCGECSAGGPEPALHELLADARWQATPASSRFPMRAG